jgi:hypothetical protein
MPKTCHGVAKRWPGSLNTRLMGLFLVQTSLNGDPSLLNTRLMGLFLVQTSLNGDPSLLNTRLLNLNSGLG